MTKGLPASGKSTWAREEQSKNPNIKRVNKDDLRSMLDNGIWSKGNEKFVLKLRNHIIESALESGNHVIVDDTNLAPFHERDLREIAKCCNAKFEVQDFTDISLAECIRRDSKRAESVGEDVIVNMYNKFLKKDEDDYRKNIKFDPDLEYIYLCDIDGTIALKGDRSPYDMTRVSEDIPNIAMLETIKLITSRYKIIFFSGRDDSSREDTILWISNNLNKYGVHLYMREIGDIRKDSIVKKEMYEKYIKGNYNVIAVFDDRQQVVDMWREQGLNCFQVAKGDF